MFLYRKKVIQFYFTNIKNSNLSNHKAKLFDHLNEKHINTINVTKTFLETDVSNVDKIRILPGHNILENIFFKIFQVQFLMFFLKL